MLSWRPQSDSYFRLDINIENSPLCSCDNGRAGFPYAVSYAVPIYCAHILCPYVVPGCPISANPPDGARSAETWGYASLAPIRWIGVFCRHSYRHSFREAVLRDLTSASRQANSLIVRFSGHEADLGGLTSASQQIFIRFLRLSHPHLPA